MAVMPPCPSCPAAAALAGPEAKGPSVICRVMLAEEQATDGITEGTAQGILVTAKEDPSTFYGFCHGKGIPMVSADEEPRAHYTFCPLWLDAWEARQEGKAITYEMPDKPHVLGMDTERPFLTDEDALETLSEF